MTKRKRSFLWMYACMGRNMMDGKRMHSIQWSSNCLSSAVNRASSGSGQTVHLVSVSINESSSVIFSPLFLLLCTAADNQDEKCKSFHILFEDGMIQNPRRGKGLITDHSSHRKLVGLRTRINLLLYFLTCTNIIS